MMSTNGIDAGKGAILKPGGRRKAAFTYALDSRTIEPDLKFEVTKDRQRIPNSTAIRYFLSRSEVLYCGLYGWIL